MSETVSFNCTSCGAGQDLLGGGRVRVHVCGYCGAELDVQDDFRIMAQFRDMVRPESPFDIGMEGTIWGVPFTVIGTIGWIEQYGAKIWEWTDHQVFSPTHGYAWLTVEDGHIVFTRKIRDVPSPASISWATIESSESRPTVRLGDRTFRYYGSGEARPVFIEGAFNFAPDLRTRVRYVALVCGHRMLTISETSGEREYEMSVLPDAGEIATSFGLSAERLPLARGVHVLDEIERSPTQLFVRNVALVTAAASLGLALFMSEMGRDVVVTDRVPADRTLSVPFEVSEGDRLTEIAIWADVQNSWASFEAELLDAEGEPVAGFEREVGYYTGVEGGERWHEGKQLAETRLRLAAGAYTLEVQPTGGEVDWANGRLASQMFVRISEGHTNPWWLVGTGLLFFVIGGAFLFQRFTHDARRWAGSDWSDD